MIEPGVIPPGGDIWSIKGNDIAIWALVDAVAGDSALRLEPAWFEVIEAGD